MVAESDGPGDSIGVGHPPDSCGGLARKFTREDERGHHRALPASTGNDNLGAIGLTQADERITFPDPNWGLGAPRRPAQQPTRRQ